MRASTLGTNWRSDGSVVAAMNGLCRGLTVGDEGIVYHPVQVDETHVSTALVGADDIPMAPMVVRVVADPKLDRHNDAIKVDPARDLIIEDLADQVARLVTGTRIVDDLGPPERNRPVHAGDIAVLIQAHSEGPPIQRALARLGVPSIITGGASVIESPAADQWRVLLAALSRPADQTRARAAALSWFWGWTVPELASAGDELLAQVQRRHEEWAGVVRTAGVAALMSRVRHESALIGEVLARPDGERDLTDLDHLTELLHQASGGVACGPAQLAALLAALGHEQDEDDPEAVKRRVDSDAAAVQIMTIHAAKGLEFRVVCCPSLWNPSRLRVNTRLFFDPDRPGRVLDVSTTKKKGSATTRNAELATADLIGEHARLTYVALTRARHQTLVWWAPVKGSARTGIASVLFGQDEVDATGAVVLPADADTVGHLHGHASATAVSRRSRSGRSPWASSPTPSGRRRRLPRAPAADRAEAAALSVAVLGRTLDRRAGRWSFTAITRHVAADPIDESLGDRGSGDEPAENDVEPEDAGASPVGPASLPLGEVGAGPAFGTMVHSVLESVDFAAPDLDRRLEGEVSRLGWAGGAPADSAALVAGLRAAIETPLGPAFGDSRLADLRRPDRLDELDFELPLGVERRVATRAIGALVARRLEPSDPIRPWAQELAAGAVDLQLGGYLTGSIDLVLRLRGPGGETRFGVIDYKTNRVGPPGSAISLDDFHPDRLPAAMVHHQYPLQALLYSVALHRYLRWRLPGYEPDRHLGPVGYLFLRGMIGPDTPTAHGQPYGVFSWTLPSGLVADLSDLLHGLEVAA